MIVTQEKYATAVCAALGLNWRENPVTGVQQIGNGVGKEEAAIAITVVLTPKLMTQIARNLEE
jgi:hypothetical protein